MHQHQLGQRVLILDPFGTLAAALADKPEAHRYLIEHGLVASCGFNPLASLDPRAPTFYDDAAALGEALIKIEGNDPHWPESAQGLLVGLIMWEKVKSGADANLPNVRALLTQPNMYETTRTPGGKSRRQLVSGLRITAGHMVARGGPAIASLASRFLENTNELGSIQSTADTQTRWLLSAPIQDDLRKPGIDFARLKHEPTTVYVILPAERLRTHSRWLRLVVVTALRSLYRKGGLRTLLLIDELAALGHLGPLEDAFGLVRGYRVQIAAILQDLNQLKSLYSERWETFIANAGVVMGFAPNDLTTAEWMSKRAGQRTVTVTTSSDTVTANANNGSTSISQGTHVISRPLFLPQELIGFEAGTGLLWLAGMSDAVAFYGRPYFNVKTWQERAAPNPYYLPED